MDRRRTAWLLAAPLLAGTAALVLGAVAAAALAVVLAPFDAPAPGMVEAGRGVLASTLGDLTDLRQLAPLAAGVLLAELSWMVGLGLAAQRLFPRRRRAIPALVAVVISPMTAWVGVGLVAGGDGVRTLAVQTAVTAVLVASVIAGMAVFVAAGERWHAAPSRPPTQAPRPRRAPRPKAVAAPRPAGLL